MVYLLPMSTRPREDALSETDVRYLQAHFDPTNYELVVDGQGIDWAKIDAVEVATAARMRTPAGWFVRNILYGGSERYHVGVYSGRHELVVPNLTREAARYVVQTIAYFLRDRVRYTGPEDFAPLAEG
jgi:hypothetical protein